MNVAVHEKVSTKVKVPAGVAGAMGAVVTLLGAFGVDLDISEDMITEAIGAVMVLVAFVQAVIGYVVRERSPAPSTIEAVRELGG